MEQPTLDSAVFEAANSTYLFTDGPETVLVEQQLSICLRLMDRGYLLHQGEI